MTNPNEDLEQKVKELANLVKDYPQTNHDEITCLTAEIEAEMPNRGKQHYKSLFVSKVGYEIKTKYSASLTSICENIIFLSELGFDIGRIFSSCHAIFTYGNIKVKSVVNYLLSLGIKKEEVGAILAFDSVLIGTDIKGRIKKNVDYFLSIGVSKKRIAYLFFDKDRILFQNLERDIEPKIQLLLSYGVKDKDLGRIVSQYDFKDNFLNRSREEIKSRIDYYILLGIDKKHIGTAIARAPYILALDTETKVKPRVRDLMSLGFTKKEVAKLIQRSPNIITYDIIGTVKPRVEYLSNFLGSKNDALNVAKKSPTLLECDVEQILDKQGKFFYSIGLNQQEFFEIIRNYPQVLAQNIQNNTKPTAEYLMNKLNVSVEDLVNYPRYLSFSLDFRIRLRHEFLEYVGVQDYSALTLIFYSEEQFLSLANSNLSEFNEFKLRYFDDLIHQAKQDKNFNLVKRACNRAKQCTSDPNKKLYYNHIKQEINA